MTGVTSDNIVNLYVTGSRRLKSLKVVVEATSSGSVQATYTVLTTNPSLNYDTLSSQLNQAVADGSFNKYLTDNAQTVGAVAMINCTSNAVATVDTTPIENNDSDDSLSDGAIAGIVIAVIFAVAVMMGAAYYFLVYSKQSSTESSNAAATATNKATDVEISTSKDDTADGVKWTDNVARKQ